VSPVPAYTLIRSKRKTLAIHIVKDASVEVRAPLGMPLRHIERFVASKEKWINDRLSRRAGVLDAKDAFALNYGDTVTLRGRPYPIKAVGVVGAAGTSVRPVKAAEAAGAIGAAESPARPSKAVGVAGAAESPARPAKAVGVVGAAESPARPAKAVGASMRQVKTVGAAEASARQVVGFDGDAFVIPAGLSAESIKNAVIWIYRQEAAKILNEKLRKFSAIMNARYSGFRVTAAKTRWGSCSSKKSLCFSWRLLMAEDDVIDYVVVHELAHTFEMNHSPRFWAFTGRVIPDYTEKKKKLRRLNEALASQDWD